MTPRATRTAPEVDVRLARTGVDEVLRAAERLLDTRATADGGPGADDRSHADGAPGADRGPGPGPGPDSRAG